MLKIFAECRVKCGKSSAEKMKISHDTRYMCRAINMYRSMYVCMHACIYIYTYVSLCIYIHICIIVIYVIILDIVPLCIHLRTVYGVDACMCECVWVCMCAGVRLYI